MTSKKVILSLMLGLMLSAAGCELFQKRIEQPLVYSTPYPGPKMWAVAPFRNESGTSLVDSAVVADHLAQQIQQINGIGVVPVNRVLAAMNAAQIDAVNSVGDAMKLMNLLGVDGLIVGTITAWDPYEPPKIGATIQLYARELPGGGTALDSRALTRATSTNDLPGMVRYEQPVATVSDHFDAANGAVLQRIQDYAHGRAADDEPAGWRRYIINMDLYNEFVSHELMRRLFAREWDRLHRQPMPPTASAADDNVIRTTQP
ncbi:MAG: hypothetical protein GC162_11345 [Planctomycetes bacterium]|nr:hypothetical protein [Planctomycetota bacterium]